MDLTLAETKWSIRKMRAHSSPGPDGVLPMFIRNGGVGITLSLHNTYQACWEQGIFPTCWKKENRIYLPKQGKESYNTPKSMRGISLASCNGKGLERLVDRRLRIWMDHNGLHDAYQYAYKKDHSTTQAMLHYSLEITKALKEGKQVITCFIDLEGAYDKVWRNGVIYKLHCAGLRGRLLCLIDSYFSDRSVRNLVNSFTGDWISTDTGVPQGSVLAPIIFTFFISDMSAKLQKHISFADDLSHWVTELTLSLAVINIKEDINSIFSWCHKWGMSINLSKTEVMAHTKHKRIVLDIVINNHHITQVSQKKVLGVVIDEKMTFKHHVDHICEVALRTLNNVGDLFQHARISTNLHIYKCLVRPHLERSYPIWCTAGIQCLQKVERVHRQALLRASGAFISTPTEVLEVICCIQPIRLRLDEILIHERTRIQRRPVGDPLRSLVEQLTSSPRGNSTKCTPVELMSISCKKLTVDLTNVEPAPELSYNQLNLAIPSIHNIDLSVGSSNTRSTQQAKMAREVITNELSTIPTDSLVIFTDGSAMINPGPVGAAIVVYKEGISSQPIIFKESVSSRSTSYHGELYALKMAVEHASTFLTPGLTKEVHIYCDCRAAMVAVCTTDLHNTHQSLIEQIQTCITRLQTQLGVSVSLHWIPGHVNLIPNELADQAAKAAASSQDSESCDPHLSYMSVKNAARKSTFIKWQRAWSLKYRNTDIYSLIPQIPKSNYSSTHNKELDSKYFRLLTGHSRLKKSYQQALP